MLRSLIIAALFSVSLFCVEAAPPISDQEGRPRVPWQQAGQVIGKFAYVSGKVINVNSVGKITFINFDDRQPRRFTGVIFADNLGNFPKPPAEMYKDQIVEIGGTVSLFKDQPQIVITSPSQVTILDKLPEASLPGVRPRTESKPGELVVAAYNVLNMFDEIDDPYRDDETTAPKPRAQLERLAESIRTLNADVVAVEEVENRDYLQRFVDVFLPDMGYEHVVLFEGNDRRGIDVGLLSRIPVGEVRSHRHLRFDGPDGPSHTFNRDVLAVTLHPPDADPLQTWVVHLKSNFGGREIAEPIRLAEARALRRLLDAELAADPQARILVVGDFNDTPESQTITTIVGQDTGALWSVATDLNSTDLVTYNVGEFRSMIDFILCSPAMKQRYVKGSCQIPQGSIETTGSDHNPIAATFRVGEDSASAAAGAPAALPK